jgi:hypothetical protein
VGYALCYGACLACGKFFSFNPVRVPSYNDGTGRKPICRACVEAANPKRIANGLPPIVPAPDAYDAVEEGELDYD